MNPDMSEDISVLEQYLSSESVEQENSSRPYRAIPSTSGRPIIYLKVPRKRKGLKPTVDLARAQREIIEQVLSPHTAEVRGLFFKQLYPCFPVLDQKTFLDIWRKDDEKISSALVCSLYASACIFWSTSESLRSRAAPDLDFIWNASVVALQEDFLAPAISTLHAALLDMVGRPVGATTVNIANAGRVVTLAQSLGLHRDPRSWQITDHEKSVRIRLWYGVLIHDYWSSISHGIPPSISPQYFDTPIPDHKILYEDCTTQSQKDSANTFFYLCKLTRILGDMLPHVYSIQRNTKSIQKLEDDLRQFIQDLPEYLQKDDDVFGDQCLNGSNNLWFAYLSVRVLMCRLAFKRAQSPKADRGDYLDCLRSLMHAAVRVVEFVTELEERQLQEFWLPYTSYLLVTAATILLRCTIEVGNFQIKADCIKSLVAFMNRLQRAKEESGWDLADFCLERCSEPIRKMAAVFSIPTDNRGVQVNETESSEWGTAPAHSASRDEIDPSEFNVFFQPLDLSEYPWDSLWETMQLP